MILRAGKPGLQKQKFFTFKIINDASMQCCDRSISLNPDNALAFNTKGNILYKLGKYKDAIECYNKAIEIEPLFVRAWYNKKMASELQLKKSRLRVHYLAPHIAREKKR